MSQDPFVTTLTASVSSDCKCLIFVKAAWFGNVACAFSVRVDYGVSRAICRSIRGTSIIKEGSL